MGPVLPAVSVSRHPDRSCQGFADAHNAIVCCSRDCDRSWLCIIALNSSSASPLSASLPARSLRRKLGDGGPRLSGDPSSERACSSCQRTRTAQASLCAHTSRLPNARLVPSRRLPRTFPSVSLAPFPTTMASVKPEPAAHEEHSAAAGPANPNLDMLQGMLNMVV